MEIIKSEISDQGRQIANQSLLINPTDERTIMITCQKCKADSKWVSGMMWQCSGKKQHKFIVDSSRPIGTGHTFLVNVNGKIEFEQV